MAFNIHQLDEIDFYDEKAEKALEKYQNNLLSLFSKSPEGKERLQANPGMGFYATHFIYFGFKYIGVTVPNMYAADVKEIVIELFPRKITLYSPEDANDVIPELIAFWHFLEREFKLNNSESILKYLENIDDGYYDIMNDPSKYGMAKSFVMAGRSAGFDMTNEDELQEFMAIYNENIASQNPASLGESVPRLSEHDSPKSKNKKKKLRKIAKSSRKKNRKRK